ncbi:MAG: peptidoglycan-binding domain-containing protein, partial [Coprobacillaceae bacterium]
NHYFERNLDTLPFDSLIQDTNNNMHYQRVEQRPLLKFGNIGESVVEVQRMLQTLNYLSGIPDGVFGLNTESAVKKFQTDYHLLVDGRVGPDTWAAIEEAINNPKEIQRPSLQKGDESVFVRELQIKLEALDYYHGLIDGVFGDTTQEAVQRFQREHNLIVDGVVGPITWQAINEMFATSELPTPLLTTPLSQGSSGEAVRVLQRSLKALNYYNGPISGNYGVDTIAAVRQFQTINDLPITGSVDQETWEVLASKILFTSEIDGL